MKNTLMTTVPLIIVLCLFAGYTLAGEPGGKLQMNDISAILREAQDTAKKLPLPVNDHAATGRKAAEVLLEQFNSPKYQAAIRGEQQRLRERVFKTTIDKSLPQDIKQSPAVEPAAGTERIYLFVSSSVPLATLRNYAAMIDRARTGKIIMVLRGFVGGMKKIRPTMEFIGGVLKKDPACDLDKARCDSFQIEVQVDPEMFQRFHVRDVPAVAYLPEDVEPDLADPLVIQGDASLDYLLERINREAKCNSLDTIIAALQSEKKAGE